MHLSNAYNLPSLSRIVICVRKTWDIRVPGTVTFNRSSRDSVSSANSSSRMVIFIGMLDFSGGMYNILLGIVRSSPACVKAIVNNGPCH